MQILAPGSAGVWYHGPVMMTLFGGPRGGGREFLLAVALLCASAGIVAEATIVPGAEKNASYPSIELDREELKRQNDAYSLDRLDLGEVVVPGCDPATLTFRVHVEIDYLFETPGLWKRWTEGTDPIGPRKNELREALVKGLSGKWTGLGLCTSYRDGTLAAGILKVLEELPRLDETEETQTLYAVHVPSISVIDPATAKELTFVELERQPNGWGAPDLSETAGRPVPTPPASGTAVVKVQEKNPKKTDTRLATATGKSKKPAKKPSASKSKKPGKSSEKRKKRK